MKMGLKHAFQLPHVHYGGAFYRGLLAVYVCDCTLIVVHGLTVCVHKAALLESFLKTGRMKRMTDRTVTKSNRTFIFSHYYLRRCLASEGIVPLGVTLSRCVCVRRAAYITYRLHAALVSAAKVMRCI